MKNNLLRYITLVLNIAVLSGIFSVFTGTAKADQIQPYPSVIQNGGFELNTAGMGGTQHTPAASGSNIWAQSLVPGWSTTEPDGVIELWFTGVGSGFTPGQPGGVTFRAQTGNWLAEIVATTPAPNALYQDLATNNGTLYQWSFWHRGRAGTDTAMMLLGPQRTLTTADAQPAAPGYGGTAGPGYTGPTGTVYLTAQRDAWVQHLGYYVAAADVTRFALYSYITASANGAQGNLADNADWVPIASPTTQAIHVGDGTPANSTLVTGLADGFTVSPQNVPDSSVAGAFQVPVRVLNSGGDVIGTITSTVNVLALETKTLTVTYKGTDGNVLKGPTVTDLTEGEPYSVQNYGVGDTITVNGAEYRFVKMSDDSDPVSGTMDTNKTVIYIFEPVAVILPAGDSSNLALWVTILAGSIISLTLIALLGRKRRYAKLH